jgi:hypothetical protein
MLDLSSLLIAQPFPTALARIRHSFARQPDRQTCGAAAIRHGLLLGGLTIPAATLESVLRIRENQGTPPRLLLACLRRLGLDARHIRKPARQPTAAFLDGLRRDFDQGGFLVPCIHGAEHWVCLGAWQDGRVGMVDSFFDRWRPSPWPELRPGLGFFTLSPQELDALDWEHFVTLVRPGLWRSQYEAWLLARPSLLRMNLHRACSGGWLTLSEAMRLGVHQYLDDADYSYQKLHLHLRHGPAVSVRADDPGGEAVGVEGVGEGREEVVVFRRLDGALLDRVAPPEVVVRAGAVRAAYLAG